MNFGIRLCLTHITTAVVAAYCAWYGLQVSGFSRIAFMVLFGAGIGVPCGVTVWWLQRGLRRMELLLADATSADGSCGLPEFDETVRRLQAAHDRQRQLVRNVDELLQQLGRPSMASRDRLAGPDSRVLTAVLGDVSRAAAKHVGSILDVGDQISRNAHDTHQATEQQAGHVNEAVSSVETLSVKITGVADAAAAAAKEVREVVESAGSGRTLVQQLMDGIEDIRANVEFSEKKVTSLGQQSERISAIVDTMESLSARTDMLALNASIEAVHAGQEGRGFAIVAEEVRKLAESTATAAREIASLVDGIQAEARDVVAAIQEERHQVHAELQRVTNAGLSFDRIRQLSRKAGDRSQQISVVTVEQLHCTRDVVQALQQVSVIADRIRERGESVRHSAIDIVETAQDLEEGLSPMYHFGDRIAVPATAVPDPQDDSGQNNRRKNRTSKPGPGRRNRTDSRGTGANETGANETGATGTGANGTSAKGTDSKDSNSKNRAAKSELDGPEEAGDDLVGAVVDGEFVQ
ncbi:MAG: methyl-accepting chemotaxis protein [Fuerstiella sp.]